MSPNPYQSPASAGYDPPRPRGMPLWCRLIVLAGYCIVISSVSFVTIMSGFGVLNLLRWLGF